MIDNNEIDFDEEDLNNYDEDDNDDLEEKDIPKIAPPINNNEENIVYLKQSEENTTSLDEDEEEPKSVKEEILKQRNKVNFEVTDTDAIRMVETFKTIGTSTFELASLAETTIREVEKVIEIGEKKSDDIGEIANFYYENKEEFLQVFMLFKEYFDSDDNIIKKISRLERLIQDNYGKFSTSLDAMSVIHTNVIKNNLSELTKKIGKISDNVDVESIINNINININKKFENVKLDKLDESLNNFEKLNKSFLENSVLLNGTKDGKRGLFFALSDQLDIMNNALKTTKKKFNLFGIVSAFFLGVALSGTAVFWYQSSNNIFAANLDNQIKISKKLKDLESKYKGYDGFINMYGLKGNKKAGFGYFDNNEHPYFFYSPDMKVYSIGGKNYVDLGGKK